MRVLIINTLFPPHLFGGAERSVEELAHAVAALGVDVTTLSLEPSGQRREVTGEIRSVYVPLRNLYWPYGESQRPALLRKVWHAIDLYNPAMVRPVMAAIRAARPDVIHTNNLQGFSMSAWHAAARARTPVAHTLRDHYLSCARSTRFGGTDVCARTCASCVPFLLARRRASVRVGAVVGVSRHILEQHLGLGFFPAATLTRVIHRAPPPVADTAREAPRDPPIRLGFLGRLDPIKGIELLIRAVRARRDARFELVVAGEGEREFVASLQALADGAAVSFRGAVDGRRFLEDIDVLVVPSLWDEPSARVLLEAMAQAVPVIASRRGGSPELVEHGVSGLLFDPGQPASLDAALTRIAEEPELRAQLSRGALARAREAARAPLGRSYLELFEELARVSRARG